MGNCQYVPSSEVLLRHVIGYRLQNGKCNDDIAVVLDIFPSMTRRKKESSSGRGRLQNVPSGTGKDYTRRPVDVEEDAQVVAYVIK